MRPPSLTSPVSVEVPGMSDWNIRPFENLLALRGGIGEYSKGTI